jgi:hypothetical protein
MDNERGERETARQLANRRLSSIYADFDEAGISYRKVLFD